MVGGSRLDLDGGELDGREGVGNGMNYTIVTGDLPLGFGLGTTKFVVTEGEVAAVDTGEMGSVKGSIV